MKKRIKICFLKFGDVISEYEKVKTIWKNNGAKLIWDINEISKRHSTLAISYNAIQKRYQRYTVAKGENIDLYSINIQKNISIWQKITNKIYYHIKRIAILNNYRIDNIVCSNMQLLLFLLLYCRIKNIKFIPYFTGEPQLNKLNIFLLKLFDIETCIVCSKHMKHILSRSGLNSKILVRIPKYPATFFQDHETVKMPIFSFIVIFVARIEKAKGIYELIQAAFMILEKNRDIGFLILGNGSEYEKVKQLIEKNKQEKNIKLLGLVDQQKVGTYLRKSDVLLFPSYGEGFGKTWLEAVYAKIPIITTDLAAVNGILIDRKTALFIRKKNIVDIFNAIMLLYNDTKLQREMKKNLSTLKNYLLNGSEFLSLRDAVLKSIR